MIYFTSDWHFCHDREFIWGPRGFSNIDEMNDAIIKRHNATVKKEDEVYVLGDLMLCDDEKGLECVRSMNGRLHIINGNHDNEKRQALYLTLPNVVDVMDAKYLRYGGLNLFLCHYATDTANMDTVPLERMLFSIHGHTHQQEILTAPHIYHVGVDSWNCCPVSGERVVADLTSANNDPEVQALLKSKAKGVFA